MKKNILLAIRIIAAIVFIVSALSKLFPAEVFELTLVNAGAASWNTAPYFARLIIAVELFLGIALLQKNYLKKLIMPGSIILLVIFSLYLIYTIIITGNTGNCGCFGELLPMSPLSALIKNIVLIALLVYFYMAYNEEAGRLWIPSLILVASLFAVNIISPVQEVQKDKEAVTNKLKDTTLAIQDTALTTEHIKNPDSVSKTPALLPNRKSEFADFHNFSSPGYVDLDSGIKIAALLSLDCEHCMKAASEIVQLKKEMKLPPVYFLYLGEEDQLQEFYNNSGAQKIPYKIINARTFFTMIKESPPRIVLLNNGNIIKDWDSNSFSKEALKKSLRNLL